MLLIKIDVMDGNGLITVAVSDLFEAERLLKFAKDAKEAFLILEDEAIDMLKKKKESA